MATARLSKTFQKTLKYSLKLPLYLLLHLVYFISFFSPRDRKIWIFGCQEKKLFNDNSKYFFLYTANNHKDKIKAVWLSKKKEIIKDLRKKGYNAHGTYSLLGIYHTLRAKYFIFDTYLSDIIYWTSNGSKKINLWHGIVFKKIEFDVKKGKLGQIYQSNGLKRLIYEFFLPWIFKKPDFLTATSGLTQKIFASAFKTNKNKTFITGYPRNDILFKKIENFELGFDTAMLQKIKALKAEEQTKIIFYLPTFRESKISFNKNPLMNTSSFDKLNDFLKSENAVFLIKLHPLLGKIKFKNSKSDRIFKISSKTDIYPLLRLTDLLITDYSSIFFDFLLLKKPIIFFPYDLDEYALKDRGFYFNYKQFTPGPKAYDFDELLCQIKHLTRGRDKFTSQRKKIRDSCFKYRDGAASERIFDIIYQDSLKA